MGSWGIAEIMSCHFDMLCRMFLGSSKGSWAVGLDEQVDLGEDSGFELEIRNSFLNKYNRKWEWVKTLRELWEKKQK